MQNKFILFFINIYSTVEIVVETFANNFLKIFFRLSISH